MVRFALCTLQKLWRNKPLFRREGDARFRTGNEAAQMLINEVSDEDRCLSASARTREVRRVGRLRLATTVADDVHR